MPQETAAAGSFKELPMSVVTSTHKAQFPFILNLFLDTNSFDVKLSNQELPGAFHHCPFLL